VHFDHAGGLLSAHGDGEPRLLFPQAKIFVGKEHWQRALCPHVRESASFYPLILQLLEKSGQLTWIEGESHQDLDFGLGLGFTVLMKKYARYKFRNGFGLQLTGTILSYFV